jgi:putative PEP-CTERM system TPR-repeat lipoprotein
MRKIVVFGVPAVVVALLAGAWLQFGHTRDPIAAARQRMAQGDMHGAALYLTQAVRAQPGNADAAFLLGKVDLSIANAAAAEQELRRARANGYDQAAIVLPLGLAYLQQRHFTELLRDFDPQTAPQAAKADTLSLRASAQMALRDTDGAIASAAQAEAIAPQEAQVLLTRARISLARGDLDTAADRAAKVPAAVPKPDPGQIGDSELLLAEVAMRRNDPTSALALAQTVLRGNPNRLDARLLEARCLAATGQEAGARKDVDAVLHAAPRDVPANFLRSMLAIHAGDFAAADASLQQIGPILPDLPRGFYFEAVTKLGLGQLAQAEDAASHFLAQLPADPNGLKLMAFIDLAQQHPDSALAVLQSPALSAQPDSDTLDLRGRALAMQGDLKAAKANFTRANALSPQDTRILNRLAATDLNLGQSQAGESALRQSLSIDPSQRLAGEAMVQAALVRGDVDAARAGVAQMRKAQGDGEAVGVLEAQIKLASLDLEGASAGFHNVLDRFPDSRAAMLGLVRVEELQGDTAGAQSLLESAFRKHPNDMPLLDALLPALYAGGQVDRAVKLAQMAHDAQPDDAAVTAALAEAYIRARQPDRAIGLLDRASAGSNAQLDYLRARLLAQQGKASQARTVLQNILETKPADIRARIGLAALLVAASDFDGARTVLREGLSDAPGQAELLAALVGVDLKQAGTGPAGVKQALATAAALRANPANLPAASFLAGNIYQSIGDAHDAADAYLAAYNKAPSSGLAIKAAGAEAASGHAAQGITLLEAWTAGAPQDLSAQAVLSSLYLEAGMLDKAAARLGLVLATNQTNVTALNNLAWIRQAQGDAVAAKALAERAYFQAARPEIADTLGWILARQGETAQALPLLKQATGSADPSLRAAAQYHYGVTLAKAGKQDEARSQVQAALAEKAAFREQEEARTFLKTLSP